MTREQLKRGNKLIHQIDLTANALKEAESMLTEPPTSVVVHSARHQLMLTCDPKEMLQAHIDELQSTLEQLQQEFEQLGQAAEPPFQPEVANWLVACFGEKIAQDTRERGHRFIEEALELVRAGQIPKEDVLLLVDYVYHREPGMCSQEIGGVMVTLAAFCEAWGYDMMREGRSELNQVWDKIDKIREKQRTKPLASPLPL